MSISVHVRWEGPFGGLVSWMGDVCRQELQMSHAEDGSRCQFTAFDIEFTMYDSHGLENDVGIEFERYSVVVRLRWTRVEPKIEAEFVEMCTAIANYLAARLSVEVGCEALVVHNLQRIVRRYAGC